MILEPSIITLKSQDPKLFRRIRSLADADGQAKPFKMLGTLWLFRTLRYSTAPATGVTTFECELQGIIKVKKPGKLK